MKKKMISLRTFVITILCLTILSSSCILIIYASNSNTFTISEGIYPNAPSFTIWRSGSNYYAKDGYGYIPIWGTNASGIIQYCIDNLPSEALNFDNINNEEQPYGIIVLRGTINITHTIIFMQKRYVIFQFERIIVENDINGILVRYSFCIKIIGQEMIFPTGFSNVGILIKNSPSCNINVWKMDSNNPTTSPSGVGIELLGDQTDIYGGYVDTCIIEGNTMSCFDIGILLYSKHESGAGSWVNENTIKTRGIWHCNIAIKFNSTFHNKALGPVSGNRIQNCFAEAPKQYGLWLDYDIGVNYLDSYDNVDVSEPACVGAFINSTLMASNSQLLTWEIGPSGSLFQIFNDPFYSMLQFSSRPHPDTTNWGTNMTGTMWFDSTYNNMQYWNGTHCIYWNSTDVGVQP